MQTTARTLVLFAGALVASAPFATAQDSVPAAPIIPVQGEVTDEQLSLAMTAIAEGIEELQNSPEGITWESYEALVKGVFADYQLNPDEMTTEQLVDPTVGQYASVVWDMSILKEVARERMTEDSPAAGAMALSYVAMQLDGVLMEPGKGEQIAEALRSFMSHPYALDGLAYPNAQGVFQLVGYGVEKSASMRDALGLVRRDLRAFTNRAIARADASIGTVLPFLVDAAGVSGLDDAEVARLKSEARGVVEEMMNDTDLAEADLEALKGAMDRFTREERLASLVGNTMPAMDIAWSSNPDVDSFDDYRGKVLVLDFWATWCGPCVASFPNIRHLREQYYGYDVAIVGVTSLQGTHYPQEGQPVDCEGDPEKEYGLMAQYIEKNNVTWDVAFTEQEVFNPDYVVEGIPHVVIVDPDGVIRHRGLHPMDEGKPEKINAILEEFGKDVPE